MLALWRMLLADLYQFVVALLGLAVESVGVELRIVVIWLSEGDSHQLRLVTIRVIRLTHLLLVRMQLLFLLLGSWIYSLLNEIPKLGTGKLNHREVQRLVEEGEV